MDEAAHRSLPTRLFIQPHFSPLPKLTAARSAQAMINGRRIRGLSMRMVEDEWFLREGGELSTFVKSELGGGLTPFSPRPKSIPLCTSKCTTIDACHCPVIVLSLWRLASSPICKESCPPLLRAEKVDNLTYKIRQGVGGTFTEVLARTSSY